MSFINFDPVKTSDHESGLDGNSEQIPNEILDIDDDTDIALLSIVPKKPTIAVNDIVVFREPILNNAIHSVILNIPGRNGDLFEAAKQPSVICGGVGTKMAIFIENQRLVYKDVTEYIYVPGTSEWKVYLPFPIKINIFKQCITIYIL